MQINTVAPHNLEGEESVLAACLASPSAIGAVGEILQPSDFYRTGHGYIYKAIVGLYGNGGDVDPVTLAAELQRQGLLDEVGGRAYIHSLLDTLPVAGNAKQYAEIVRAASLQRSLVSVGTQIAELGYSRGEPQSLMEKAEELLYNVRRDDHAREGVEVKDLVPATQRRVEDARKGIKVCGHSTTFSSVDDLVGGFAPGTLILLAARPSVGKSSMCINILQRMATDHYVALFSLEMNRREIMDRMLCSAARVSLTKLRTGTIDDDEQGRLLSALYRLENLQFHIDDSDISMTALRSKVRRLAMHRKLDLVAVDYLQLMGDENRHESRNYELAEISRGMKQLAREFNLPVLCLSQLSRPPKELAHTPRPKLSDLRDSGALEQDADQVLFLHRPDEPVNPNKVTLIVGKNRNGAIGEVDLTFEASYTRFSDSV